MLFLRQITTIISISGQIKTQTITTYIIVPTPPYYPISSGYTSADSYN